MNFQKDILPQVKEKLLVIINTKDKVRKKQLLVNLVSTIELYQSKYKFTKNQTKILDEILKIIGDIHSQLDSKNTDVSKPASISVDDLKSKFTFDVDDLASKFTFNQPKQTKKSTPKKAGRKFDTSWVKKFLTEAPMEFIEGDLEKFIQGDEDKFIYQYKNDKGVLITYMTVLSGKNVPVGQKWQVEYIKKTESKYNSKTKTRTKQFKNKKEFLAALKRIIK